MVFHLGSSVAAPGENVGDDAHGRADGIDVGAAGDVFLEDVVLHGAGEFCEVGALLFGDGDVQAEKNGGGGVDGHRGGDFFERDAVEERFHVFERIDGDADFADFAERERMIGVHADLRGQIEGHGESGSGLAEQIAIALVGFGGGAEAGVLAHGPEAAAVHGGINAAGVGKFAGIAEGGFGIGVWPDLLGVEAVDGEAGERGEVRSLRSRGAWFWSDDFCVNLGVTEISVCRSGTTYRGLGRNGYSLRARRNEVTQKTERAATQAAMASNQWATSRVQARKATLSQANARTAKDAPVTS